MMLMLILRDQCVAEWRIVRAEHVGCEHCVEPAAHADAGSRQPRQSAVSGAGPYRAPHRSTLVHVRGLPARGTVRAMDISIKSHRQVARLNAPFRWLVLVHGLLRRVSQRTGRVPCGYSLRFSEQTWSRAPRTILY